MNRQSLELAVESKHYTFVTRQSINEAVKSCHSLSQCKSADNIAQICIQLVCNVDAARSASHVRTPSVEALIVPVKSDTGKQCELAVIDVP